jgi:hypothetical protein
MIYTGSLDVAANTTAASPQEETFKMSAGVIHDIKIEIPSGHAGLTGLAFYIGGHRLYPSSEGMWFSGDNRVIEFREWYKLNRVVNYVKVRGYNTDTQYSHKFFYEFGVLEDWQITPWLSVKDLIKWIKILLGKIDIQNQSKD